MLDFLKTIFNGINSFLTIFTFSSKYLLKTIKIYRKITQKTIKDHSLIKLDEKYLLESN